MITQHSSALTGVAAVNDLIEKYGLTPGADGLEFLSPSELDAWAGDGVRVPPRLEAYLNDVRLLRHVPLAYLVPDPDLLPPESIRFFHVNQTWVDRVIDGMFSTTSIGTVDFHYSLTLLQRVRALIDPAPEGMTGMLVRSELVRRWPRMQVAAFATAAAKVDAPSGLEVLRAEPVSRDVFIALFAGQPKRVHLREPFDGVRYGVEVRDGGVEGFPYVVDRREATGELYDNPVGDANQDVPVTARNAARRTIDVLALRDQLWEGLSDSRGVALHLEQRPFVQVFLQSVAEGEGSKVAPPDQRVPLRNGRLFELTFAHQALFHAAGLDD